MSLYHAVLPDKTKLYVFLLDGVGTDDTPDLTVFCESEEKYAEWMKVLDLCVGKGPKGSTRSVSKRDSPKYV